MTSDINGKVVAVHPNVSTLQTSNYTISTSNYVVGIGTLTSSITVSLPIYPQTGDQYIVKDVNGSASTFAINVSGNGLNIDGSPTFTIAQNYAACTFLFSGVQWSVILCYAGQQNGNGFGSFANRPIQGQAGRTYYATDSACMYYDDGYNWNPMGQVDYCTGLKTSDFSWLNQAGATSTDFGSGIFITLPAGYSGFRMLYQSVPSTPYTLTTKFVHLGTMEPSEVMVYGLGWSDGTKLITAHVNDNGDAWNTNVALWDDVNTFNSEIFTSNSLDLNDQLEWLRISDDGTNKTYQVSRDGVNYTTVYSFASSTFLTATQIGIVVAPAASAAGHTSVMSWKIS